MQDDILKQAAKIAAQMTTAEKISQMLHNSAGISALNIDEYNWWNEALHGVARAGKATMFPQAISMSASFDPQLIKRAACAISDEARAKYNEFSKRGDRGIYKGLTFWTPHINIFRDPRWGRGQETYGEDPYLTSKMAVAFIQGMQGNGEYLKTAACAKHFVAYSGPEALRHSFNAEVSEKDLRETYLPAFKAAIKQGKVESVMCAYNRINGEPCCGTPRLNDILRKEWGFKGHVVSDCWAVQDMHMGHGVTADAAQSAALAVKSGVDLNCGSSYRFLPDSLERGLITEEQLSESVVRLIAAKIKLGLFSPEKVSYNKIPYDVVACEKHLKLSRKLARESIVLLKNENILPLSKKHKNIGVIGPNADNVLALCGNYYGTPPRMITPLDGLRSSAPNGVKIDYAIGCQVAKEYNEYDFASPITEAEILANRSDIVIMFLGFDASVECEEGDNAGTNQSVRDGFKLPLSQTELFNKVKQVGKPIILVMMSGSAVDITEQSGQSNAVLQVFYPGGEGGAALADIIWGKCAPCGKLPITIYKDFEKLPSVTDYSMVNRTYRYFDYQVLYPFGYGLSYSHFNIERVSLQSAVLMGKPLTVAVTLRNEGAYTAKQTVQLYIKVLDKKCRLPKCSLASFKKVQLRPSKCITVTLKIMPEQLNYFDDSGKEITEPTRFKLFIGFSSPHVLSCETIVKEFCTIR